MHKWLLVIPVALAVGVGLLVVANAGAQGETPAAPRPFQRLMDKVAEKLGVTSDQLNQAFTDAQLELLDEDVAQGRITQEQADRIRERINEGGPFPLLRPHGPRDGCHGIRFTVTAAAGVLGLDPEDVAAQLRDGKSLAEIAGAQGMSVSDFTAALTDAVKADLDSKVADGVLPQERAAALFAKFSEHVDEIVNHHAEPGAHPCRPGPNGAPEDDGEPTAEPTPEA